MFLCDKLVSVNELAGYEFEKGFQGLYAFEAHPAVGTDDHGFDGYFLRLGEVFQCKATLFLEKGHQLFEGSVGDAKQHAPIVCPLQVRHVETSVLVVLPSFTKQLGSQP